MKDDVFRSGTEKRVGEDRERGLWSSRWWTHRVQAFTVCRWEMETKVPCPLDAGRLPVVVLTSPPE